LKAKQISSAHKGGAQPINKMNVYRENNKKTYDSELIRLVTFTEKYRNPVVIFKILNDDRPLVLSRWHGTPIHRDNASDLLRKLKKGGE
jgi:hypothetical protein